MLNPQIYNCHLCTFSADTRATFSNHVNTHYQFQCVKCEFETKVGRNETKSTFLLCIACAFSFWNIWWIRFLSLRCNQC